MVNVYLSSVYRGSLPREACPKLFIYTVVVPERPPRSNKLGMNMIPHGGGAREAAWNNKIMLVYFLQ